MGCEGDLIHFTPNHFDFGASDSMGLLQIGFNFCAYCGIRRPFVTTHGEPETAFGAGVSQLASLRDVAYAILLRLRRITVPGIQSGFSLLRLCLCVESSAQQGIQRHFGLTRFIDLWFRILSLYDTADVAELISAYDTSWASTLTTHLSLTMTANLHPSRFRRM